MNYRHGFHAGNFADVAKHVALVSILLHLRKKGQAFAVIDTHAGRGLYDLKSAAARRTGEAERGIGRVLPLLERPGTIPPALKHYLDIVKANGDGVYPGSPMIAARLLRPQDRLVAVEKSADEQTALTAALARMDVGSVRCECADGYARLRALLPPPERRALVMIDPPFEAPDEFALSARALGGALKRFASGTYLLWFPIKSSGEALAFGGEVLAAGAKKVLRIDLEVGDVDRAGAKERLSAAGLIVVNPPFGLAKEMEASLAILVPLLSSEARSDVRWLAGGET